MAIYKDVRPHPPLQGLTAGFPYLRCQGLHPKLIEESAWLRTSLEPWTGKCPFILSQQLQYLFFGEGLLFQGWPYTIRISAGSQLLMAGRMYQVDQSILVQPACQILLKLSLAAAIAIWGGGSHCVYGQPKWDELSRIKFDCFCFDLRLILHLLWVLDT